MLLVFFWKVGRTMSNGVQAGKKILKMNDKRKTTNEGFYFIFYFIFSFVLPQSASHISHGLGCVSRGAGIKIGTLYRPEDSGFGGNGMQYLGFV